MNARVKKSAENLHCGAGNTAQRVISTAQKLRMAQISFAEEDAEQRGEYLEELIGHDLESVFPEERKGYLQALQRHFPCLDCTLEPGAAPASEEPALSEATLDMVVDRLMQLVEGLEDDERGDVLKILEEAGLSLAAGEEASQAEGDVSLPKRVDEAVQYLLRQLGMDKLDLARTVKLVTLLVQFTGSADDVVWKTWRTVAPRSSTRRPFDLQKEMHRYITGDRSVSGINLMHQIDGLKKMMASMIAGVGQAGATFSRAYMSKYSPQSIEAQIEKKGGGLLSSQEYKCWNRYVEVAAGLTEDAIEHEIKEAIAKYTEYLLKQSQE